MKKPTFIFLSMLCLTHAGIAYSLGEMIMVESKFEGRINSFQYKVNGEFHHVCTGGSQYCPNREFISIDPNKDYVFNIYDFDGSYIYNISDSCMNKVINVKPDTGKTITIVRKEKNIICEYSR
jgi:hypothetical protein